MFLIPILCALLTANPFGYITPTTTNIGDDIQAVAARKFLPQGSIPVTREFLSTFTHTSPVNLVVNGWFMHHRNGHWELPISPPEKSWPPSSFVHPLFISIHFADSFLPIVLSKEHIDYLKEHGPIGARDFHTLEQLQLNGVPSYFSGCLTLTLDNPHTERNETIYLVDLDKECVDYIRSVTSSPIVVLTHGRHLLRILTPEHRLKYAEHQLELYQKCKCIITTRLHAAMPCLAFGTPVLLLDSDTKRFPGLIEHTFHCSKTDLLKGRVDYSFDHPPENPNTHLPIREQLIDTMTKWVTSHLEEPQ